MIAQQPETILRPASPEAKASASRTTGANEADSSGRETTLPGSRPARGVRRLIHKLTPAEQNELALVNQLGDAGIGWRFWRNVARSRLLDPGSIMSSPQPYCFTALPLGHGKWWCYPIPLRCRAAP